MLDLTSVTLSYFDICGRGEPICLILEDAGVPYTQDHGVAAFAAGKMNHSLYLFNQMPRLTARGYTGKGDIWEDATVDMLDAACEVRSEHTLPLPGAELMAMALLPIFVKEHVPKVMKQFEFLLSKSMSSQGYFVYDIPSCAEFHLLYLLHCFAHLNPALLANFPLLTQWRSTMLARPGLKSYFASSRMKEMLKGNANGQKAVV
ncbi:SPOSA6832_02431 [Sporobolomyces salmonicolor]|uniref:SPOSA6832_02431-mRNA-1:cds n=1 Tax=Sporidiobolus salmonicolor TaxID=5005 RepID=A0A0D6ELB9_SPOSA|nr:SPOSA6832_02431 [Sporobolomyces salmonicolor]